VIADRNQDGRVGHLAEHSAIAAGDAYHEGTPILGQAHGVDQIHADPPYLVTPAH
jgi:hypothetical protein